MKYFLDKNKKMGAIQSITCTTINMLAITNAMPWRQGEAFFKDLYATVSTMREEMEEKDGKGAWKEYVKQLTYAELQHRFPGMIQRHEQRIAKVCGELKVQGTAVVMVEEFDYLMKKFFERHGYSLMNYSFFGNPNSMEMSGEDIIPDHIGVATLIRTDLLDSFEVLESFEHHMVVDMHNSNKNGAAETKERATVFLVVREKRTNNEFIFTTGHLVGYWRGQKNLEEARKVAEGGRNELSMILDKVEEVSMKYPNATVVAGMDFNEGLEVLPNLEFGQKEFETFSRLELARKRGYGVYGTKSFSEWSSRTSIDYFIVKSPDSQLPEIAVVEPQEPDDTPVHDRLSDHRPVTIRITL